MSVDVTTGAGIPPGIIAPTAGMAAAIIHGMILGTILTAGAGMILGIPGMIPGIHGMAGAILLITAITAGAIHIIMAAVM